MPPPGHEPSPGGTSIPRSRCPDQPPPPREHHRGAGSTSQTLRRSQLRSQNWENTAACAAEYGSVVTSPYTLRLAHPRIPLEHHRDRTLVRVQLRPPRLAPIPRRLIQRQQPSHRIPAHPQPLRNPRLRHALPMEQPMDLSPIMHFIHPFLPRTDQTAPGSSKTAEPPRIFRPARSAQYSPDVDMPLPVV